VGLANHPGSSGKQRLKRRRERSVCQHDYRNVFRSCFHEICVWNRLNSRYIKLGDNNLGFCFIQWPVSTANRNAVVCTVSSNPHLPNVCALSPHYVIQQMIT